MPSFGGAFFPPTDNKGLRDLNSARLKITERYLLCCDEIFAVCNIGRATTDLGVKEVFELARRASLSKIGIVCTRSDVSLDVLQTLQLHSLWNVLFH